MEEIEELKTKERKLCHLKWYLGASFFPVNLLFIYLVIAKIKEAVSADLFADDQGVMESIIVYYVVFSVLLIIGYIINKIISHRIKIIDIKKMSLINK